MEKLFIVLGLLLTLQSLLALAGAIRFARYALRPWPRRQNRYQPKAVVIVPCKGLDHDFEENIRSIFAQEYREYEIILVTESESDPAWLVLNRLLKQTRRAAWMVIAGEARGRGQKVHNLCAAIEMLNTIDRRAEVLVFADSDASPTRHWLSDLVAPLGDKRIGATTGFRWFLPGSGHCGSGGGIFPLLLSVWNASALSLLGEKSSFAWGGGMAIRRENFDKLGIKDRWRGAVSDDYVLTRAVRESGQRIKFVPKCLVVSPVISGLKDLIEFTTRQIRITRIYSPRVWKLAGLTHLLYNLTFWGGLAWLLYDRMSNGRFNLAVTSLLLGIYLLGVMTGWIRVNVAARLVAPVRDRLSKNWWVYALTGPVVSLIYLYNFVASIFSNRIVWRGIGYELISPHQTVIWRRPSTTGATDLSAPSQRRRQASVRSSSPK